MSNDFKLIYFEEPNLLFGYDQEIKDPRDGLTLFGPLETKVVPYGVGCGIIGTRAGINKFRNWLDSIQKPIYNKDSVKRPFFPGFEAVFNLKWESNRLYEILLEKETINDCIYHEDRFVATFNLVELYTDKIIEAIRDDEININFWVVVIPDEVYQWCRPEAQLPKDLVRTPKKDYTSTLKKFALEETFFDDINIETDPYKYDINFRNQFKARMLPYASSTQIIRESTLEPETYTDHFGNMKRKLTDIKGHIAWSLSSTAYYKIGGKPWKLGNIRSGVCYIGLAYKQDYRSKNNRNACCAAQMFLDSGDGTVFKGAVGPWYNPVKGDYHLSKEQAKEIMELALRTYQIENERIIPGTKNLPKEIFIHAKNSFNQEEYEGFCEALPEGIKVICISIKKTDSLKIYTQKKFPVLRGLAYLMSDNSAYLWTQGFVPRLQTSLAAEVPNCLAINISQGKHDINVICKDILALTKLNYNACIYADGLPVTLRFADNVGEILTAAPFDESPPLAFRYYI